MTDTYDLAVIGGGSGGLTVAAAAAQFGQRVVLFERGRMGGDCLNSGCVPSKALIAAAKQAQTMRSAARFGIAAVEPEIDYGRVMDHVRSVIADIAPHDSQERFESLGVRVVRQHARFADARTLVAEGESYTARRIVIATGSRAAIPPIQGLGGVPYLTNETLFENRTMPHHLVIIGGGPIGIEMAQAHRRLGARVTVIEAAAFLGKDDPELAAVITARLEKEGVRLLGRTKVRGISGPAGEFRVETEAGETITGSHLLVAAGRAPNVEDLGLEAAGIAFTRSGVSVDKGLRTSNRRVYAIGDVAGGPQFTHAAGYHAGLVIRNALFGLPVSAAATIPWVTYSDPELAQAGLTEAEARKRHGDAIRVLRSPFAENDRARTEGATDGLVKIVTDARGKILGAGIAGPQAGDLIQPFVHALARGARIGSLMSPVLPYPTRGEAGRRAALGYYSQYASNPWVRRVIGVVKLLRP